jgi:hypothetical protein
MTKCDYCGRSLIVWHTGPNGMTLCKRERCKNVWREWLTAKVDTKMRFEWLLDGKEWHR